jgi:hypothetical protein
MAPPRLPFPEVIIRLQSHESPFSLSAYHHLGAGNIYIELPIDRNTLLEVQDFSQSAQHSPLSGDDKALIREFANAVEVAHGA